MKAIIIAAGSGTRFSNFIPKPLIEINGKTILERQIELFKKNKINDIVVIIGSNDHKFTLKNIKYVRDDLHVKHDILCSLMVAKDDMNDEILISYSDILYDETILREVISSSSDIGIAVDKNWEKHYEGRTDHPKSEAENVLVYNDKISKIKKNISKTHSEGDVYEFLGIMKMSKIGCSLFLKKFEQLKSSHKGTFHTAPSLQKAYLTDMIQELIDSGIPVSYIPITGNWCEIDTQQDIDTAKHIF